MMKSHVANLVSSGAGTTMMTQSDVGAAHPPEDELYVEFNFAAASSCPPYKRSPASGRIANMNALRIFLFLMVAEEMRPE